MERKESCTDAMTIGINCYPSIEDTYLNCIDNYWIRVIFYYHYILNLLIINRLFQH